MTQEPTARRRGWRWLGGIAAAAWLLLTALSLAVHWSDDAPPSDSAASPEATPTPRAWIPAVAPADERRGDTAEMEAQLRALGYLDAYERASDLPSGAQTLDAARTQPGATMLVSSHAPEAVLIALDGEILHRWSMPFERAFPEIPEDPDDRRRFGWRRARLVPESGGEMLAVFEGLGLLRVDRNSQLLWARSGGYHHDVDVGPDGRIYALYRQVERLERGGRKRPYLVDYLHVLSPDGELLASHSLLDALGRSPWSAFLQRQGRTGDLLHTNAVTWLDGRHSERIRGFARGNLLLSSLTLDLVFTVDPATGRVPWALAGPWLGQHEPRLLPNGHLLIFDNLGGATGSRVLEVDPRSHEITWRYEDPEPSGFASLCCGTASRLANGNTLIVDSTSGRAFEVTPSGELTWEYRSQHRRGSNQKLVAVLFDAERLGPEATRGWLER